ncbi:hypothetical protein BROUX41_001329 [Berkeleyomyces rouxiae]
MASLRDIMNAEDEAVDTKDAVPASSSFSSSLSLASSFPTRQPELRTTRSYHHIHSATHTTTASATTSDDLSRRHFSHHYSSPALSSPGRSHQGVSVSSSSRSSPVPPGHSCSHHDVMDPHNSGFPLAPSVPSSSRSLQAPQGTQEVKLTPVTGRVSRAKRGIPVHYCQECNKTFTRAEHLRRHSLSHGRPEFPCPFPGCSREFHRKDLLERHRQKHENEQGEAYPNPISMRAAEGAISRSPSVTSFGGASAAYYPPPNNNQSHTLNVPVSAPQHMQGADFSWARARSSSMNLETLPPPMPPLPPSATANPNHSHDNGFYPQFPLATYPYPYMNNVSSNHSSPSGHSQSHASANVADAMDRGRMPGHHIAINTTHAQPNETLYSHSYDASFTMPMDFSTLGFFPPYGGQQRDPAP